MDSSFNILIVEDNPDDVFFLKQAFIKAASKSQLHAVSDGLGALAFLSGEGIYSDREKHPFPDVLLLDLNMPRMNGFEVLEWVRQDARCARLLVYVLTSSSRESDIRRAYDLRANSYVMKPSRMDELVDFVQAFHHWHCFICLPPKPDQFHH